MVFKSIQAILTKLIDEKQKHKVRSFGSDFKKKLKGLISSENLPIEYGGNQQSLEDFVKK